MIRTANEKDKRYKKYRDWLSGKYTDHPERYYTDIIALCRDIESMLDALLKKELYVKDIERKLNQKYPDIELSLPLEQKNIWETLIKDSMHYNEAMMVRTVVALIHDIEKYIIILPQSFDDGSFEAEHQRELKDCANFTDFYSLFDEEEIEQLPIPQLINLAGYQEKCRNLLFVMLNKFRRILQSKVIDKALAIDSPDAYLSYIAAECGLSSEATENLIAGFYDSIYDGYIGPDSEAKEPEPFLPMDRINHIRFLKMIQNDAHIQELMKKRRNQGNNDQ